MRILLCQVSNVLNLKPIRLRYIVWPCFALHLCCAAWQEIMKIFKPLHCANIFPIFGQTQDKVLHLFCWPSHQVLALFPVWAPGSTTRCRTAPGRFLRAPAGAWCPRQVKEHPMDFSWLCGPSSIIAGCNEWVLFVLQKWQFSWLFHFLLLGMYSASWGFLSGRLPASRSAHAAYQCRSAGDCFGP